MDLNRVAAFARVVQDGSFTAAAKALGVPKSTVSRSVAQLEEDLGTRLLHRTTRRLNLTEAGTAFYDRVARALGDIDEATAEASARQAEPRGTVRLTAPLDLGVWALASILARFAKRHPTIHVDVQLGNRAVDLVAEGIDLAVRAGTIRDQSLVARRVGAAESALFASSRYVARRGTPASLADLAQHDAIVFRPGGRRVPWALRSAGGRSEEVAVNGVIASDDMSFVKKAALAGAGIGLIPRFLCSPEEQKNKLVRVLPEWSGTAADVHVVYPSARFVPRRTAVLRDFLVEELKTLFAGCIEIDRAAQAPARAAFSKKVQEAAAARSHTQ